MYLCFLIDQASYSWWKADISTIDSPQFDYMRISGGPG